MMGLQRAFDVKLATTETSDHVQNLASKVDALTETIETAHNNQLDAIRDQLISKMEALPLMMIDDEAVVKEIRSIVANEVQAAFERRK